MNSVVAAIDLTRAKKDAVNEGCDLIGGIEDIDVLNRDVVIKVGVYYPESGSYSTVETVDSIIKAFKRNPRKYLVETDNYQGTGTERLRVWKNLFSETVIPINLSEETETTPVNVKNPLRKVTVELANLVLKPHVFVDTHVMRTYARGSILKNLFGLPPTRKKVQYHKSEIFFNLLTSLYEAIGGIDLTVLDATYFSHFLKGKGARAKSDLIFVGRDAVAVEALGLHLAGFKLEKNDLIQAFVKKKLGVGDLGRIEVVGVPLEELEVRFGEIRHRLELEIAQKPNPWSASKSIDGLIRSGYFKTTKKRSLSDVVSTLEEQDPRARGREKMIYATAKRRLAKGKLQGEKTDEGWMFWKQN